MRRQGSPGNADLLRHLLGSAFATLVVAILTFLVLSSFASSEERTPPASPQLGSAAAGSLVPSAPIVEGDPAALAASDEVEAPTEPAITVTGGVIDPGDSLASAMESRGVSRDIVNVISREMAPHFDFRRAQPGHEFELTQDESGRLISFRYVTSPVVSYELLLEGEGYTVRRKEEELLPRLARIAGVVNSSVYSAVTDLGGEPQVASDFTDIFAWDMDFSRSVQPGDEFRILYQRLYRETPDGSQVFVRPGKILAARYRGSDGDHDAIYFETEEGRGGYYRPDGTSVQRAFLQAPLRYSRISSSYSTARLHPILKIRRPHQGIDYAAPTGTPIWSVADGEVIYRGWAGGFGNLIKVRHRRGYVSYYAHLSRFAKGIRVGSRVSQKQVIGFVGQTGLATGPHVCFRIQKDGKYVNPSLLRGTSGPPLPAEVLPVFAEAREALLGQLDGGTRVATDSGQGSL